MRYLVPHLMSELQLRKGLAEAGGVSVTAEGATLGVFGRRERSGWIACCFFWVESLGSMRSGGFQWMDGVFVILQWVKTYRMGSFLGKIIYNL